MWSRFAALILALLFLSAGNICAETVQEAFDQGVEYFNNGMYDAAILTLTIAIQTDPRYPEPYNERGAAYYAKGSMDEALADFNKAIEINPQFAEAYNNRAISYFRKKDYESAWEDVHRAQKFGIIIHPGFLAALKKASGRER